MRSTRQPPPRARDSHRLSSCPYIQDSCYESPASVQRPDLMSYTACTPPTNATSSQQRQTYMPPRLSSPAPRYASRGAFGTGFRGMRQSLALLGVPCCAASTGPRAAASGSSGSVRILSECCRFDCWPASASSIQPAGRVNQRRRPSLEATSTHPVTSCVLLQIGAPSGTGVGACSGSSARLGEKDGQ